MRQRGLLPLGKVNAELVPSATSVRETHHQVPCSVAALLSIESTDETMCVSWHAQRPREL